MKITIETEKISELYKLCDALSKLGGSEIDIKLNEPIEVLHLTSRTEACLKAEDIFTLAELTRWTEVELLKTPNIGKKSLTEIKEGLAIKGMALGRPSP